MNLSGWRVLTISDLYPSPPLPASGIFVELQAQHTLPGCDLLHVVVPVRVFPPWRIWREIPWPRRFVNALRQWAAQIRSIPAHREEGGIPVHFLRYSAPPRPVLHGSWGFFAYVFLRRSLRSLHRAHAFNIIHAHYAVPAGTIALLAKRWMKVPVVVSVHGSDVTYTTRQRLLGRWTVSWVLRHADAVLANSRWTAERIQALGVPASRIHLIPLGAEPPMGAAPPRPNDGEIVLLTVAYLEERKGHAYVLRALARLREEGYPLTYRIVGTGSQEDALRNLAQSLGIGSAVRFEGYRRHLEVWDHLRSCDIFVLPSWNEAFGVAYIEALSVGKPVIGSIGEGGPEDLRALGDCIELVRSRDVDSLTNAIRGLLDNPARRASLAEEGRRIVQEHYSWKANARLTLAAYRHAADG